MLLTVNQISPCCDISYCMERHYEDPKDYAQCPEKFCEKIFKGDLCNNALHCCKTVRLYLDETNGELQSIKTGERYIYLLTDEINNKCEIIIESVCTIEKYIECYKHRYDFSKFNTGQMELKCILDYDKMPDMHKLAKFGYETFPTFHESKLEVVEKDEKHLHLKFSGGFHPLITHLIIYNITKEEIRMEKDVDPYDYFTQDMRVGRLHFQTEENGYIVKISDNYIVGSLIGWKPDLSDEEIDELSKNPDNRVEEEHINEYFIHCSDIKFEFFKRDIDE